MRQGKTKYSEDLGETKGGQNEAKRSRRERKSKERKTLIKTSYLLYVLLYEVVWSNGLHEVGTTGHHKHFYQGTLQINPASNHQRRKSEERRNSSLWIPG